MACRAVTLHGQEGSGMKLWLVLGGLLWAAAALAQGHRERLPEDELIYFLLPDRFENGDPGNDRGGLSGDRLSTGFDPTAKGFFLGGDLKGLTARLDYIEGLGATAIWLGPIYQNKPVQGPKGRESAGYHGYWITDFTRPDAHFGSEAEFAAFVAAAHARGMKVYLDIITNHTADVIRYRGCAFEACTYRSRADYPYSRRGGPQGVAINPGFLGDTVQTPENFAKLDDMSFAYEPFVPDAERDAKVPAWLNDPRYYHNRGDTSFRGEDSRFGDFAGLDDLFTEDPRVVSGMIDIFGGWIDRYKVDGFRIDTARHVNPEFWQAFVPAMLERAKANGIPNFHIFGEVYDPDPGMLARFTRVDRFPAVLDFAFQAAVVETVARDGPTDRLTGLFERDVLYAGGEEAARRLPTFLGNHDMGRVGHFIDAANPRAGDTERLARARLAHTLLLTLRGVPTIYYGDEQGMTGDGGDQDAREPLFPSRVKSYNDNRLIGSTATPADANFDTGHPLYRHIAALAALRNAHPALRRGTQTVLASGPAPGLFVFERALGAERILVAVNTSGQPIEARAAVDPSIAGFRRLDGACPAPDVPGSWRVALPAFGHMICRAE
jgi:glycosidase